MKRILFSVVTLAIMAYGVLQWMAVENGEAFAEIAETTSVAFAASDSPAPQSADSVPIQIPANSIHETADLFGPSGEPFDFSPREQVVPVRRHPPMQRVIRVPVTKTVYETRFVEMDGATPLQKKYSILMLKRAQRMTEDELNTAIADVEAELKEQDETADTELQKAIEILEALKQASGGTPAARRAEQALPVLNGTGSPSEPQQQSFGLPFESEPGLFE